MKIAVCVKQVPDSWAEKKMVNGVLDRESVDAVLNDLDEYAVEEALRIAEAHGGNEEGGANTVTVISMGPERATEAVRKALSMGANGAILVTDGALAGADALATSAVLAKVISDGGYDLVICGTESTDARMSVVPAMISARLGWAQLTFASKVTVDPAGTVAITRVTEAGVDEIVSSRCKLVRGRQFCHAVGIQSARADQDRRPTGHIVEIHRAANRRRRRGGLRHLGKHLDWVLGRQAGPGRIERQVQRGAGPVHRDGKGVGYLRLDVSRHIP